MYHYVRACVCTLSLVLLAACIPARNAERPAPNLIHPVSTHAGFSGGGVGVFEYDLLSSTNCAVTGAPLTLTLVLTNTGTVAYRDELPVSIIDLEATGVLTTTEHVWRWSDTTTAAEQRRSIDLAPNASLQLRWDWTVDPRFRTAPPPRQVVVKPVFNYRDSLEDGRITAFKSGGYLAIPVDTTPGYSCVPAP